MYCCMMPLVSLNKEALKLDEINQNDSGISPSYCCGDSRGSEPSSPVSPAEDCGISTSTPLNLADNKSLSPGRSNPKSPESSAVALSQSQLNLIRNLASVVQSGSQTNRGTSRDSPLRTPDGTSLGTFLGAIANETSHESCPPVAEGTSLDTCGSNPSTRRTALSGNVASLGALSRGASRVPHSASPGLPADWPPASPRCNSHDSSRSMSPMSSASVESDYREREHPLRQLALVVERNEMLVPAPPEMAESNSSDKTLIHCPLCNYTTNSRCTFNAHLHAHEGQRCCYICELMTESVEELRQHYQNVHDVSVSADFLNHSSGGEEEQAITVPKLNSQGKVKKHRCKQCGMVCVTKLEFWEHCRGHIKQERLLTCPKCPFVTEYKHHLEYHLRNHFGSKPFKCTQCSYSCVNKSMLNSHLKSHSNVYQFRCNDCSYATKYCHSLKLHLRKYQHAPAMVLNPDGSPNPLPIVDVYGTRRGPKQRPRKPEAQRRALPNPTPFANQSNQPKYLSSQAQIPQTHSQFLLAPTTRPPAPTTLSSASTTLSPVRTSVTPAPTLSPSQSRFSPSHTVSPNPRQSPKPGRLSPPQTSPLSNQQFTSSSFTSQPYPMFPTNYGLFPPFPYPLVPNAVPLPSLSLLQLDIPTLLEKAETLERLKQFLQSNNNNSQYISKAVAQQIIDEASKPCTPPSENPAHAAPLDLSKPAVASNDSGYQTINSSAGANRRKGKAVKRVALHSIYYDQSDGDQKLPHPVQFRASSLMTGTQKIY